MRLSGLIVAICDKLAEITSSWQKRDDLLWRELCGRRNLRLARRHDPGINFWNPSHSEQLRVCGKARDKAARYTEVVLV